MFSRPEQHPGDQNDNNPSEIKALAIYGLMQLLPEDKRKTLQSIILKTTPGSELSQEEIKQAAELITETSQGVVSVGRGILDKLLNR